MAEFWEPPLLVDWCADVDKDTEPPWLIKGLMPTDSAILVSGAPTVSFKTWYAMATAEAVASGATVAGLEPEWPGPVLFIEQEGPRKRTKERWDKLEKGHGVPITKDLPIYFSHREEILLDDPAWVARIADFVKRKNVVLVIIDTLAQSHRGDENSSRDISRVTQALNKIRGANKGCSVMLLHHLRKEKPDQNIDIDQEIRGSGALPGYYDTHHAIRKRTPSPYLSLTVRSNEDEEREFRIRWEIDEESGTAQLIWKETGSDEIDDELIRDCYDELLPGDTYTEKRLREMWNMPQDKMKKVVNKLMEKKTLLRVGKSYALIGDNDG